MTTKYRVGDKVRHIATGETGTVTQLNPKRKPSVSGKVMDLWVKWDVRENAIFGSMFTEIEKA